MLIFVTHDGIKNSVFDSQVLKPLQQLLYEKILIISFEKKQISPTYVSQKLVNTNNIEIIILKRGPFLGKLLLIPELFRLKKILKTYKNYKLIARGPIAGWLCVKTIDFSQCVSLTLQARGLLAKELEYTNNHAKKNSPQKIKLIGDIIENIIGNITYYIHKLRVYQLYNLEKYTYQSINMLPIPAHIEAVSCALKEYIASTFGTNPHKIKIAKQDIPRIVSKSITVQWRTRIRKELKIPETAKVYCYNGSVKPWQCPDQVINFFKNQTCNNNNNINNNNKSNFLLILTQDIPAFETLAKKAALPFQAYSIKKVAHRDIYVYLAACDYGIIFREPHIVNWVSRPTKILEYRAVGLKIIHNNTIGFLQNGE